MPRHDPGSLARGSNLRSGKHCPGQLSGRAWRASEIDESVSDLQYAVCHGVRFVNFEHGDLAFPAHRISEHPLDTADVRVEIEARAAAIATAGYLQCGEGSLAVSGHVAHGGVVQQPFDNGGLVRSEVTCCYASPRSPWRP